MWTHIRWFLALVVAAPAAGGAEPEAVWKDFRKGHPYHFQTVALTGPEADGTRVLVVSEPPPHATREGITGCVPGGCPSVKTYDHPVGYDGYVRDLVAVLPKLDGPQTAELIDRLHEYLYFSTYKAEALDLPLGPAPAGKDLNLEVSAQELAAWVDAAGAEFRPVEGGKADRLRAILAAGRSGVFLSGKTGLVAWTLPRTAAVADHRARARQFAVDSDLVLGAIATKGHWALIGRQRTTSPRVMPPLRVETLELLATAGTGELAQSYERNRVFAGRFDKEWDWAPILLSPQLINTEYGGLLNITDQLLKGWSEKGTVEYVRFDYPKPAKYPFDKPLHVELQTGRVTFNWNTAGAGYTVGPEDGDRVLALNRTGSLPISYIPGGSASTKGQERTAGYENTAYDYYARLGDSNLVRVTQYAAVYQAFRAFAAADTRRVPDTAGQAAGHKVLTDSARAALDGLRQADEKRLEQALRSLLGGQPEPDALRTAKRFAADIRAALKEVDDIWGGDGIQSVAAALANPRALSPGDLAALEKKLGDLVPQSGKPDPAVLKGSADARTLLTFMVAEELTGNPAARRLLAEFAAPAAVREAYAKAVQSAPGGWIRTPSIVVSRATGESAGAVGGHNLGSKVTEFRPKAGLPAGKVEIEKADGRVVIRHSPADASKVDRLVRRAGKEADNPELKKLLETELGRLPAREPRAPTAALYPSGGGSGGRGYDRGGGPTMPAGWEGVPGTGTNRGPAIQLSKKADGTVTVETPDGEVLQARSQESLIDLLTTRELAGANGGKFQFEFAGFQGHEVKNVLKTCELHAAGGGRKGPPGKKGGPPAPESEPPGSGRLVGGRLITPGGKPLEYQKALVNYDLSKATVHPPEIRVRPAEAGRPGEFDVVHRVDLVVKEAGTAPMWFRVRMGFRDRGAAFRERVLQASPGWVKKRFGTPPPDEKALLDATTGLKQDALDALKADLREHGLEVELEVGVEDSIFDKYYAGTKGTSDDADPAPRGRDAAG
jgi:hypothetical protein